VSKPLQFDRLKLLNQRLAIRLWKNKSTFFEHVAFEKGKFFDIRHVSASAFLPRDLSPS